MCRRLHNRTDQVLEPERDLAFRDNFRDKAKKNTLMNEFLESGLGKEHSLLKNFVSMRYCKNSPYANEVKLLTSPDPAINRLNLSKPETRQRLLRQLEKSKDD